jgi:hypothetical protein
MANSLDIKEILKSIQDTFTSQNVEIIEKKNKLMAYLGEYKEEIDAINQILQKKLTIISFTKALQVLDQEEIELLLIIAKSKTKKEIYRKGFNNADPYDADSWSIIDLLESLNLIMVHRDTKTSSVKLIECLVPMNLINETLIIE